MKFGEGGQGGLRTRRQLLSLDWEILPGRGSAPPAATLHRMQVTYLNNHASQLKQQLEAFLVPTKKPAATSQPAAA